MVMTPNVDPRKHLRFVLFFAVLCVGINLWCVVERWLRGDYAAAAASACVTVIAGISTHLLWLVWRKLKP